MSTSGGFTPAADAPCYLPRMTRAAAIAMRTAGTLRENCIVVVTDGPVVNGSATEIELNPVSPTAFGQTARVFTTFDNDAWPGIYDIDLGAGTLTELRDRLGNTAKDVDVGGATVTTFPWGVAAFRDNYAEDTVMTAWTTQVGNVTNNRFVGSTIDLTGKTAGAMVDSVFTAATVTSGANFVTTRAVVSGATVSNAGAGALTITDSEVSGTAVLTVTGAATGTKTINRCTIGDRWLMNITGTGSVTLTGTDFRGRGANPSDAELGGSSPIGITDCQIMPAFGLFAALDFAGSGTISLSAGYMAEARFTFAAGSTSGLTASTFSLHRGGNIAATAAATGLIVMQQGCVLAGGSISQSGAAALSMFACQGGVTIIGAAAATRGCTLTGCVGEQFTVTQNGTGSTNLDSVTQSVAVGTIAVNLNSTNAATPAQSFVRLAMTNGATLNVVDPAGAQPMDNCTIQTQSTVNLQAGGTMSRCRVAGEATLNTGAFSHIAVVVELQGTTTLTAANVNRQRTAGFSNVI